MRRTRLWLCSWLVLAVLTRAHAEEFYGFGPVPMRNFQPIQLIFLNLPVERARTLPAGAVEAHLESVESNTIALVSNPHTTARLKFESNRTVIGSRVGLRPGLDLGVDVPFISRFGGFLDPVLNTIERAVGNFNGQRRRYPDNSFGAFFVRHKSVMIFEGHPQTLELGDVWFSAKQEILRDSRWPLLSLRAAVKAPTGRSGGVLGSGRPDFGLGFAAEYQPLRWLMVYGNLSGIYPVGPVTPGRLTLHPFLNQAIAFEAPVWRNVSFVLQQEAYTSPFHDTGVHLLDHGVVELALALNVRLADLQFQLAGVDNLTGVESAADFSLMLRASYQR